MLENRDLKGHIPLSWGLLPLHLSSLPPLDPWSSPTCLSHSPGGEYGGILLGFTGVALSPQNRATLENQLFCCLHGLSHGITSTRYYVPEYSVVSSISPKVSSSWGGIS